MFELEAKNKILRNFYEILGNNEILRNQESKSWNIGTVAQNIGTVAQSGSILFACYGQTLIKFILNQNSGSIEPIMAHL